MTFNDSKWRRNQLREDLFKGNFSFSGIPFKNAIVTQHGLDYGVRLFLEVPDYKTVKVAVKELRKVEKKFFGSKANINGSGYNQSGESISSGTYSKQDATKFAKYLLRLNEIRESVYDDILKAIPDNHSYKKLALDIGNIIKNEYGSHNIKPFMKELSKVLKEEKINEIRKGDYVEQYGEIGLVNKLKGQVVYVKFDSNPKSFHPIMASSLKKSGKKYNGKDLYTEGINEVWSGIGWGVGMLMVYLIQWAKKNKSKVKDLKNRINKEL